MNKEIVAQSKELYEQVDLLDRFRQLGPNARRVLLALAERLVVGIPHGDFDKPHDWDKESSEEALDLAVYQAAKLLGLGKAEEPRKHVWGSEFRTIGPDGQQVDSNGRTPDGKPWIPPAGSRVRVVFQPSHGKGISSLVIEGQTLTVAAVGYCFSPDFAEIGFNEHKNGELRHCRVVPAGIELEDGLKLQTAREYTAPDGVRVSLDGRTSDGMPWVPSAGARVRIVYRDSDFVGYRPNVGYVGTVLSAEKYDTREISVSFLEYGGKLCRVVPA